MTDKTEKFFCNTCKQPTNHFVQAEYNKHKDDESGDFWLKQRLLIVECCGCEHLALIKKTLFSEDIEYSHHPVTGEECSKGNWDEIIYPPVSYRALPDWFDDLPDPTIKEILQEIYKSLQTESHYLATFGSRTLIDRLFVLTVGDKGNFAKGMQALLDDGKISQHEREVLNPVLEAGHAAAHRAWSPSKDLLATILDTVEGLIYRLLVLPKLAEELEEAVPSRSGKNKQKAAQKILTTREKIEAAPKELKALYDALATHLNSLGGDIKVNPQKHYIAFRRNRNFAAVQIYNQKKLLKIYLNVDPDTVSLEEDFTRDVRQIGHFGTGDLEIIIKSKEDIKLAAELIEMSYAAS